MEGNPYENPGWRGEFRPGGRSLTEQLVALSALPAGARILDIGCGTGQSAAWLHRNGFRATGIDASPALIERGRGMFPGVPLLQGRAESLGVDRLSQDAVLLECALSVMDAPVVLSECARVLRPGGRLLLSDVYARGTACRAGGLCLRTRPELMRLLKNARFCPRDFKDVSAALSGFLAQKMMDGEPPEALLGCGFADFRKAGAGYFLLWAEKKDLST